MKSSGQNDDAPPPEAGPDRKYVIGDRNAVDVAAEHGIAASIFYNLVRRG